MKKRFIILIDFSEYSTNLLQYTYDWSKNINAELLLVHKTAVIAPALTAIESRAKIIKYENSEALKKLIDFKNSVLPDSTKVSYYVSEISMQAILSKLLSEPFENLIFVGLKGTSLLKKIFIGSIAVQVIKNLANTTIAIPKDVLKFSPKKIFVAVNDKYPTNILALNNFLDFIGEGIENITFFYMAKAVENNAVVQKQLKNLSIIYSEKFNTTFTVYEENSFFGIIKTLINSKIEELLVVQKGSRFLTDQIFRKFMINELIYDGQTPLVVLP